MLPLIFRLADASKMRRMNLVFWIYSVIIFFQHKLHVNAGPIGEDLRLDGRGMRQCNSCIRSQVVFPQFHEQPQRKKRHIEDSTLLVLNTLKDSYYIELQLNEDLSKIPIVKEHNSSENEYHMSQCHFHGKIISKPNGLVAISTCFGKERLTGVLMTEEETFFLYPSTIKGTSNAQESKPHYLVQQSEDVTEFCGVASQNLDDEFEVTEDVDIGTNRVKRAPPSPGRKIIELAVFVDSALYKKISETSIVDARSATIRRVLNILNQVQLIYNYSSLDTKFKFSVVKLEILKTKETSPDDSNGNIDKYLNNFCVWQKIKNAKEGTEGHWDHAIMLTGKDLFNESGGKTNRKLLGLAWVNGMCRRNYSCTIIEGANFEAAFVIAHEIAHNLGVLHDGNGNDCDKNKYIMSSKTGPGKVHWSRCSNRYINEFILNGRGWCLTNEESTRKKSLDLPTTPLPGLIYSLADQCNLALGTNYTPYRSNKEPFNNVCRELWCASGSWAKAAHPALEGSPCGNGKLCMEGYCRNTTTLRNVSVNNTSHTSVRRFTSQIQDDIFKKIQNIAMRVINNMGL